MWQMLQRVFWTTLNRNSDDNAETIRNQVQSFLPPKQGNRRHNYFTRYTVQL
jgi:hypothetical protein